jgi:peroxiredoxin
MNPAALVFFFTRYERGTAMSKSTTILAVTALAAAMAGGGFYAQAMAADVSTDKADAKKELALGDAAPEWKELEGVDGKKHSLADLKKAKAVVVVFTCNHCPVAQAYEDRLVELNKQYADKDVALVAINVSNAESDKLPAMKDRAEEKGFEFEYLYDPSQAIGRKFGASVTPHAFVLDGKRKVVYRGAIDDDMDAAKASKHYVRDAVDAVLAGEKPAVAESKQFGCGIRYE